jgi:DDE superfamily endonuclease
LLEVVPIQNVWNLDETALQHKTTSSHSYVTINSDGRGVKCSKERITVTPIVSASGEKLIPQVIGKSKQPCVLRGIDIDKKYQVKYDFQSKAWQDGSSMLQLFCQIAGVAQSCKSKFYLLLDNCSLHVWAAKILHPEGSQETYFEIANLVFVFFPPNTTSNCQPLDQGII